MTNANITVTHPLRAAVLSAAAAHQAAQVALDELKEQAELTGEDIDLTAATDAEETAEEALSDAQQALANSDCPRAWELSEGGFAYDTIIACSAEAALSIARDRCDRANYNDAEGTLWIDVRVECEETGEKDQDTVTLDEPEPDCSAEEHDFQQSYALFGGIKENPGCSGHGGGVIIHEVCAHCGCKRVTDTWAQRSDTGEQGLRSVRYETAAFSHEELRRGRICRRRV